MNTNELLDRLNDLLPAQFSELVFRLGVPEQYLSHSAPQAIRATELLRYVMQNGQLSELATRIMPRRPASAAGDGQAAAQRMVVPAVKILLLAANPLDTTPLALGEEARAIHSELLGTGHRDRFAFETRWAVRPLDLLRELRRVKPTVVHFSGHGGVDTGEADEPAHGLYFQGEYGGAHLVTTAALEQTFQAAGESVRVVVLNSCYSEPQAVALAALVDCVIGVDGALDDGAARSFSIGFYGGLGDGESVAAAFEQGCAAISLDAHVSARPRLLVRGGVDARRLVLSRASCATPAG